MKMWKGLPGIGVVALGTGNLAFAQASDDPAHRALQILTLHEEGGLGWHEGVLALGALIFLVVFGWMFYSVLAHRRSGERGPSGFRQGLGVEFIWCLLPFVMAVAMAWPAASAVLAMSGAGGSVMRLEVRADAGQWRYADGAGESSRLSAAMPLPLVVPADMVVHVQFAQTGDGSPAAGCLARGWLRAETPGRYRLVRGPACQAGPAYLAVRALSAADFDAWTAGQARLTP